MRIIYVEDDQHLGKATYEGLKEEYAVDWFRNIDDADEAFSQVEYDLIILDINLPKISGLEWLRNIRSRKKDLPVLLLTARDTIPQKIEGLDAGADDYMVKPYDFEELLARIRALVRRRPQVFLRNLKYKDLEMDYQGKSLSKNGINIPLSAKEFEILRILLENQGRVLSKEHISDKIYGWDDEVESNTVEVHVSALRRKIGKEYIHTLRGLGYMVKKT